MFFGGQNENWTFYYNPAHPVGRKARYIYGTQNTIPTINHRSGSLGVFLCIGVCFRIEGSMNGVIYQSILKVIFFSSVGVTFE